ncbi:MAG: succinate dehydrogenase [Burkholderiales bacterium]|nr:succinate dehydrogenase [Burkholderiales bacterium]MDE1926498.1 succinate dehydrogenase [Burkholderiales bacterium]MDE2159968.1 succinate dehydrogenase [Burkholderiales bacterium]MDE2501904.1 succinate dehydrogenase [Burkholderiales bacterium]
MSGDAVAQARRWYVQRLSAMVLALCVAAHLALIFFAVHRGLDAAAILGRTRGSVVFGAFYTVFVAAAAAHVPPGLMNIAVEWFGWPTRRALWFGRAFGLLIVGAGLRAVYAVVVGP